jgi:hypothetical protein
LSDKGAARLLEIAASILHVGELPLGRDIGIELLVQAAILLCPLTELLDHDLVVIARFEPST